jgi:hypothetical protein
MKTTVEWLIEELLTGDYFPYGMPKKLIEMAKQMEKEQIKSAYYTGGDDEKDNPYREAEQYYNETFGGDDV